MANDEQLKILKQGVEVWNLWREGHLDVKIDLTSLNLQGIDLQGVNLQKANLRKTDLRRADLKKSDLRDARLQGALLRGANLRAIQSQGANLQAALLRRANLQDANLEEANLQHADLSFTPLASANFQRANISGCYLYGTARDDWNIEGILCDYVYWNNHPEFYNPATDSINEIQKREWNSKNRVPKDRDFRPGEFEELYKALPTLEYYFERGFTPIDAVLMDKVVQAVNEQHPDFELKLDSFHSRGQPHAVFTVQHKEQADAALQQIRQDYESRIQQLQGKEAALMQVIDMLSSRPQNIELVLGDKRMITTGRDYHEQTAGDTIISD